MIRLDVTVDDIDQIVDQGYTVIRVYTASAEDGSFTTLDGTIALVADQTGYSYVDTDGTTSTWYKVAYYGTTPGESAKSSAQQGGTVDAYCTALDVRKELAIGSGESEISQAYEDIIWDMCVEASRLIDEYKQVEQNAYMASDSATRYVDGNGRTRLTLPWPAVSISAVAVEETDGTYTSWDTTDYYTWPYHGDDPILRIDVNPKSDGSKSVWIEGPKRVKVVGVFGISSTAPDLVARACKMQVAQWYKLAAQGWAGTGGMLEMGELEYPKKLDTTVKKLVDLVPPHRPRI